MKEITITALITLAAALVQAQTVYNVTVTTTNTTIVPQYKTTATTWTNGTAYAADTYIQSGDVVYWTPNGGTSTNQPTLYPGAETKVDTVTWVACTRRKTALIANNSTGDLYVTRSSTAATAAGPVMVGKGASRIYSSYAGEINAITSSGTVTVGIELE